MKLFEATWRDGYECYERYFDTELNKSVKNRIMLRYEWYEESSKGHYQYILDPSVRLEKKQGNAKDGKGKYGFLDPMYRNIRDNYWGKDSYNLKPRVFYLDIETRVGSCSTGFPVPEKALEPISLIQVFDNKLDTMFVFGVREWKHENDYDIGVNVKYIKCKNEIKLIETYLELFKKLDPLIITAWNGLGFDFPYIYNRMKNLGMDTNQLSNHGNVSYNEKIFQGKTEFKISSDGHFFVDLMKIYKGFVYSPRPSYSLDNISQIELGENKVDHSEYSTFDGFYTGDYNIPINPTDEQKNSKIYKAALAGDIDEVRELAHSDFVYYGAKDTYLIYRIDSKLNLLSIMIMISEKMGVQLSDSTATVKPWSQFLLNRSQQTNQIMPRKTEHNDPNVVGGYVRDPVKGKHKWVLSADVTSMYPLLGMVSFNMSPETFVPKHKLPPELRDIILAYFNDQDESKRLTLKPEIWELTTSMLQEHNLSLAINGALFSREKQGMIPELVQEIFNSRKTAKKTMFKYQQQKVLIKDILNSRG